MRRPLVAFVVTIGTLVGLAAVTSVPAIWTLVAFVGAVAAGYGLRDAARDLGALATDEQNGRRKIAAFHVQLQAVLLVIQAAWFALGLLALRSQTVGQRLTVYTAVLIGTSAALAFVSVVAAAGRIDVRRHLARRPPLARALGVQESIETARSETSSATEALGRANTAATRAVDELRADDEAAS